MKYGDRRILEHAAAQGVNWNVWRVVASPFLPDGLTEVTRWSFRQLYETHVALDALEALDARHKEDRR